MSDDLNDEQAAIQSIYGQAAFRNVHTHIYILSIPRSRPSQPDVSLRLSFPEDYPNSKPEVLGTESVGSAITKGYGKRIVDLTTDIVQRVYTPGFVCLFDVLQELETSLPNESDDQAPPSSISTEESVASAPTLTPCLSPDFDERPNWTTSTPVTEKKSTFVARACSVKAPQQAKAFISYLLDTDKRTAKATHNISAYRIHARIASGTNSLAGDHTTEISYQDCDDDGESAAGGRLLHLLQVMDVWDVLVVVSRWYGGKKLGPDRFSIINNVAREAVINGGWTKNRVLKD